MSCSAGTAAGLTLNGATAESRAGAEDRDCICLMDFFYRAKPHGQAAAGRADVACEISTNPWDHAAGMALLLAAGGGLVCRNHDGTPATPVWKAARYVAYGRGFAPTRSSLHGIVTPPIQSGE